MNHIQSLLRGSAQVIFFCYNERGVTVLFVFYVFPTLYGAVLCKAKVFHDLKKSIVSIPRFFFRGLQIPENATARNAVPAALKWQLILLLICWWVFLCVS
jgi:hypothetical protein